MLNSTDFAQSIAEAARTLYKPRSLHETMQTIVEVACNSVPGFDHAGISTVEKQGTIQTEACTSDLVLRLDAVQYELREGPCSAVLHGNDAVCVSILEHEQRWPVRIEPEVGDRMVELATGQPGFLGVESARGPDGIGITVSYWSSLEAIAS